MNEDWDDMAAAEPLAGEELERMLARYARVRLDPSQAQARRARAAVMEVAWRARIGPAPAPARRRPFAGWSPRRLGVSLSAAVLAGLMLGSTAFATTRAGGPLYETRLALEALTLPTDPAARVDAELAAAETRLAEAMEASARNDGAAVIAALAAYDRTISELAGAEGDAADRALAAIQYHHEVLAGIAARVPSVAAAGVDRALANSERVMERLTAGGADGTPGNGNPGGGGQPGGKPTAAPTEAPDDTVKPGRTKDPDATPKPAKTEKPEPTEVATGEPTQKPGKTPPPRKTPDPGKPGGGEREPAPTKQP